jgi:hypothetical protein
LLCALFLYSFYIPSFINSRLLRLVTHALAGGCNIVVEIITLGVLWIFFLITSALVTVCSRPYSFGAVLTPYCRNNSLISNGAGVITKSAAFLRLLKHSVGFAGACYPSFSSLRLWCSRWATAAVDQIVALGVPPRPLLTPPIHAKLTLLQPSTINLVPSLYRPLMGLSRTHIWVNNNHLGQRPLPLQEPCTNKTSTVQRGTSSNLSHPFNVWFTPSILI